MTIAEPGATAVKMTEQLPDTRLQLAPTVTTAIFDEVKLTVAVGVFAGVVVSETEAIQVEAPLMLIEAGAQETVVEVLSLLVEVTVMVAVLLVLVL